MGGSGLGRLERGILLATLVTLYSALPTAIVRDVLQLAAPLWPMYLAIYALVGLVLATRPQVRDRLWPQSPLIAYSVLPLISVAWSEVPIETLLQAATLLGTVLVGVCMAAAVPAREAIRLFAAACTIGVCLDLVFSMGVPSVGVHQDGPWVGTWKGLHDQKNGLGAISVLALLVLMAAWRAERKLSLAHGAGLLVAMVMLAASKSTTSWLVAAACVPFLWLGPQARRAAAFVLPPVIAVAVAALLVLPDVGSGLLEALPKLVGKDQTLSNRLPIWSAVESYMVDRWWLGYGYGAFWSPAFLPTDLFQSRMFFVPTSAHSSYIEVRLALGMVGMGATLATLGFVVLVLAKAHIADRQSASPDPVLPLVLPFVLFLTLTSLTESVLLQRNAIVWVAFMWLAGSAAQQAFGVRCMAAAANEPRCGASLRIR